MPAIPKKPGKMPRRPKPPKPATPNKKFKFRRGQKKSKTLANGDEHLSWADWHKRRLECWERDKKRCVMCNKSIPDLKDAEIDHIRKRSLGGPDNLWNLRTMCKGLFGCHEKRHRAEEGL